jgi:hypothetical protein
LLASACWPESQRCGTQELAAVNHSFAPLGLVRFPSLPHGLRRGLHYFAASRLGFHTFATVPREFSFRCFAALTDATPVFHRNFSSCQHFYSSLGPEMSRNRRGLAMVARFGPAYLMIQVAATHRRLKPRLMSLSLWHD